MHLNKKILSLLLIFISVVLYLISLFFIAFEGTHLGPAPAWILVLFGWTVAFSSAGFIWWANVLLWISWFTFKKPERSLCFSLFAFLISLLFLFVDGIKDGGSCSGTDWTTHSCYTRIIKIGAGYYLWLISSLFMLILNIIRKPKFKKRKLISLKLETYLMNFFKNAFPKNDEL